MANVANAANAANAPEVGAAKATVCFPEAWPVSPSFDGVTIEGCCAAVPS